MTSLKNFLFGRTQADNYNSPSSPIFRSDRNFTRYSPLQLEGEPWTKPSKMTLSENFLLGRALANN